MAIHLATNNSRGGPNGDLQDSSGKQATEKLAARVRTTQLTNAFRARMSFASFKSIHSIEQARIDELEAKLPPGHSIAPITGTRRSIDSLLPDQPPIGGVGSQPSLYSSLLSPRASKRSKRAESLTPFSSPRKPLPTSPSHSGQLNASPRVKTSSRKHPPPPNAKAPTAKDDMKAAATLTSLMMSSKTSAPSAATSPRPLSRTSSDVTDPGVLTTLPPREPQHQTPPVSPKSSNGDMQNKEAAELMMFLATSPSPARKSAVKHNIPPAATRILFMGPPEQQQDSSKLSHMTLASEKTLTFVEPELPMPSSQASTATMIEGSLPPSKSGSQSSIPFPESQLPATMESGPKLAASPRIAPPRFLKSPLRNTAYRSSHLTPEVLAHPIAGNDIAAHHANRGQFSPSKVPTTHSLGAGINLTSS